MTSHRRRPEVLAPAGTEDAFAAALAAEADAVYLGLAEGFHARSRSNAFLAKDLPSLAARAHRANAKLYVTLNTLVFENELEQLESLLREIVNSGVDALIIQDPATAFLARALNPKLALHASTQMTISSAESARFAATLGVVRVVLPRELNVNEIRQFVADSPLECEVFVHGALCMAWSGQCLTSEAFSGRSANRGQCSQACRMPYQAVLDGQTLELGDLRYLLSPQDLAAHEVLPELMDAGVSSWKIEGRYKGPAYVATAVQSFVHHRDALLAGQTVEDSMRLRTDVDRTQLTFSRGASLGFLRGDNHQTLVVATTPKHRGLSLGNVSQVRPKSVVVTVECDSSTRSFLRNGVGIKFEPVGRSSDEHDPEHDPGGPLFGLKWLSEQLLELEFGQPGPDLTRVRAGDAVRLTGDPEINREVERKLGRAPGGRIRLTLEVHGTWQGPLTIVARGSGAGRSLWSRRTSTAVLERSREGSGLDELLLREKLGALGGTPFVLDQLIATGLEPGLYLPVSELKQLRRDMVLDLDAALVLPPQPARPEHPILPQLRAKLSASVEEVTGPWELVALCRTDEQLDALIQSNPPAGTEVELDWMEMVGLRGAVERALKAGLRVILATVRVQKPGEEAFDRRIASLAPHGVLVRHWGGLMHFASDQARLDGRDSDLILHGDFSLNVTNSLTAHHLLSLGLHTVTASHDLNREQLLDLLLNVPRGRIAVTLHHHIPTFHNSHCVYAHLLSSGADYRSCGRPCEAHRIALRDYAGHEHPVLVDVSCRNTVFNALAQSAAPLVPKLLDLGVRRFRVEFVWEQADDVQRTLAAYRQLLAGKKTPLGVLDAARVHERYGVTTPLRIKRERHGP